MASSTCPDARKGQGVSLDWGHTLNHCHTAGQQQGWTSHQGPCPAACAPDSTALRGEKATVPVPPTSPCQNRAPRVVGLGAGAFGR